MKKLLVLAPHTDDTEFGCGGTVARMIEEGYQVRCVAFSDCKESIPDDFPPDALAVEMYEACQHLGLDKKDVQLLNYQVRRFNYERQRILEDLVSIRNDFKPDIVFTPCTSDIHQDHKTITEEAIRAFKTSTIYGYELPWNLLELPSRCLFKLTEVQLQKKIDAIACYKSQGFRPYRDREYTKALALTRGTRIGVNYAEAFEVIRIIH